MNYTIEELISRYPILESCMEDIQNAADSIVSCFKSNHKLLIAGNGGSAADADHIVGELMKSFCRKRPLSEELLAKINSILASANSSNIMRQGIKIAIVGKPNVGKSSLFNTLLNVERAIVTDIAGTTRDVLKETLDWDVAITLIDTAGIRDNDEVDKVEEIGIEYSKQSADEADLVIFLYDVSKGMDDEDKAILDLIKDKNHIVIANKCDLIKERKDGIFYLSTETKEGLDELKNKIKEASYNFSLEDTEFITNNRQQDCLVKCKESLTQALEAAKIHELQDLISIDLKSALLFLDEITGEVITDDILNNIFDHFCIGK